MSMFSYRLPGSNINAGFRPGYWNILVRVLAAVGSGFTYHTRLQVGGSLFMQRNLISDRSFMRQACASARRSSPENYNISGK